ncbi:hypothetical protein WJX84_005360 [Apatococcus fuscideae]|uniref:Uncharacterized protein n=1 Tax=Apatococcus fuscideae TaxID=2026836 RepID=A0AAW1S7Z9_9CHLO
MRLRSGTRTGLDRDVRQFAVAFEDGQTVHFQALATTRAWKVVDNCLQRRGLNKHSHRAFYQMENIDSHQTIAEVFGEPGDASGLCSDPIQIFAERSGGMFHPTSGRNDMEAAS